MNKEKVLAAIAKARAAGTFNDMRDTLCDLAEAVTLNDETKLPTLPNQTRGQEIAEHVFRLGGMSNEWMMMERSNLPGHPHNLFLFRRHDGAESPTHLLPLMRASLAAIIDAEILRERQACAEVIRVRAELSDFDNAYNHGARDAAEAIMRRTDPNYVRKDL